MSLSRNIFYTFLTQIPVQLFGIVSGILMARMLGPEGKGAYAIYHANAMLLVTFFSFSINTALTYFLSSGKIDAKKQIGLSILITVFGSVFSFICITLFATAYFKDLMIPSSFAGQTYYIWMGVYTFLSLAIASITGIFQGFKKFSVVNRVAIQNSILSLGSFVILFSLSKAEILNADLPKVLWILSIVAFINLLQFLFSYFKHIGLLPDFSFSYKVDIKPILVFLLPAHLSIIINFFNYRLTLWFLNYHLDEITIGLFALAANLGSFFTMVATPISNVMMPYLASENINLRNDIFSRYSRLNFSIIIFGAVVAFFLADYILPFVYGEDFAKSSQYFKLMLPGIIAGCQTKIFASYIIAHGKQKYNLLATVAGFTFSLGLCFILIPTYGGAGAAWVTNATNFALLIVVFLSSHLALGLPFKNHYFLTLHDINKIINDGRKNKSTGR